MPALFFFISQYWIGGTVVFSERETIFFEHLNKLLLSCTTRFPLCPGLLAKHYKAFVIKILGIFIGF